MKLDARRVEAFLRDPGTCRLVVLYGDDVGLIRDRAARLTRAVAGSLDDPFRVLELDRDAAGGIPDAMASLPLTGGRRVIRVREATDAMTAAVQRGLAGSGTALLVLEGITLAARSKLRALAEQAADAAAIACYPRDAAALMTDIQAMLAARGVRAEADALRWLASRLGGDQAITQSETEKLTLYAGDGGTVDLAGAQACVGDLAGLSLDDALFAATGGDVAATDRSLDIALSEGAAPVAVIRGALAHLQRLHRARIAMADGLTAEAAVRAARPPVFFRREPAFARALSLWPEPALATAATRLSEADRACKRTGSPAELICRSILLGLAQRAAAAGRRSGR